MWCIAMPSDPLPCLAVSAPPIISWELGWVSKFSQSPPWPRSPLSLPKFHPFLSYPVTSVFTPSLENLESRSYRHCPWSRPSSAWTWGWGGTCWSGRAGCGSVGCWGSLRRSAPPYLKFQKNNDKSYCLSHIQDGYMYSIRTVTWSTVTESRQRGHMMTYNIDSIFVSAFVAILVEFDKYRIWDEIQYSDRP